MEKNMHKFAYMKKKYYFCTLNVFKSSQYDLQTYFFV